MRCQMLLYGSQVNKKSSLYVRDLAVKNNPVFREAVKNYSQTNSSCMPLMLQQTPPLICLSKLSKFDLNPVKYHGSYQVKLVR